MEVNSDETVVRPPVSAKAAGHSRDARTVAMPATAFATNDACVRVYESLTRSIGAAGTRALFGRALEQSRNEHPVLGAIHVGNESDPILTGVHDAVSANGEAAIVAGLETMLGALLTLLGRLIGDDMVTRLMAQIAPSDVPSKEDRNG